MVRRMRAEPLPDPLVTPFRGEMAVQLPEGGGEAVRVAQRERLPVRILHFDQVTEHLGAVVEAGLEHAMAPVAGWDAAAEIGDDRHLSRVGAVGADHDPIAIGMDAEHRMGIVVRELDEPIDLLLDLLCAGGASHRSPSEKRSRAGIRTQSGR
jgi:hypothetical protein